MEKISTVSKFMADDWNMPKINKYTSRLSKIYTNGPKKKHLIWFTTVWTITVLLSKFCNFTVLWSVTIVGANLIMCLSYLTSKATINYFVAAIKVSVINRTWTPVVRRANQKVIQKWQTTPHQQWWRHNWIPTRPSAPLEWANPYTKPQAVSCTTTRLCDSGLRYLQTRSTTIVVIFRRKASEMCCSVVSLKTVKKWL